MRAFHYKRLPVIYKLNNYVQQQSPTTDNFPSICNFESFQQCALRSVRDRDTPALHREEDPGETVEAEEVEC
jgi:hypothetical protein